MKNCKLFFPGWFSDPFSDPSGLLVPILPGWFSLVGLVGWFIAGGLFRSFFRFSGLLVGWWGCSDPSGLVGLVGDIPAAPAPPRECREYPEKLKSKNLQKLVDKLL